MQKADLFLKYCKIRLTHIEAYGTYKPFRCSPDGKKALLLFCIANSISLLSAEADYMGGVLNDERP